MEERKNLRVGVINWDNSLPPETWFGHHTARVESPADFRGRVPYYAELTGEGVRFHAKTAADVDAELSLAISAGIDYFAYCWYSEEHWIETPEQLQAGSIEPYLHELNHTRKLHAQSPLREKLRLCAVLICPHRYSERDFALLAGEMCKSYYEKENGRPIVCLFGGYHPEYVARLRSFPEKYGTPEPYIVFFNAGEDYDGGNYDGADAVSDYACCGTNVKTYAELTAYSLAENEKRKRFGPRVLPHFTMGWDPSPRIRVRIPWTEYPDCAYAADAAEEEYLQGAASFADWIEANRESVAAGRIHVFAWNEFEEGGWICPTHTQEGETDCGHLKTFQKITEYWRKRL